MRTLLIICACALLLATASLPIGYYTFLRIVVSIGAGLVIVMEYENGLNFWVIAFGLILIVFNPILPIYLHNKAHWVPIDIISAIMFIVRSFINTYPRKREENHVGIKQ